MLCGGGVREETEISQGVFAVITGRRWLWHAIRCWGEGDEK